jgi:hypothetical protein
VTEEVMQREGFSILEICLGRTSSKNSVLEGLSMRRFAYIHEDTLEIAHSREETFPRNLAEEKQMEI